MVCLRLRMYEQNMFVFATPNPWALRAKVDMTY